MRAYTMPLVFVVLLAAFGLPATMVRAADAPKTILHMDFGGDDPGRVLSPADAAAAVLTTDPAEGIGGRKSLKGDSRGGASEWNEFFHSKTGLLAPKEVYTVSFDYRIIARAPNAKFYVLARRAGSSSAGMGWKEWAGETGETGHVETAFTTRDPDNILIIGIQNKGALAINNLTLASAPAPRPPDLPAPKRTWKSPGSTAYYVDSGGGNDASDGHSARRAWRTLDRVNAGVFGPGDHILLKSGSRWIGFLSPGGSGAAGSPITISRYGSGSKPAIDVQGKFLATVYLFNGEYWDVSDLDIQNLAPQRIPSLAGVQVRLTDFGTAHGIRLHHLDVHNVSGSNVKDDGGGNGIYCDSSGSRVRTRYDGLTIEHCNLTRTDRNGITMGAYYARPQWPLSTRVVIRGNVLEDIGGDGIVPIGCDGCLIEHNTLRGGRQRAQDYAAGIWPWSCDNTVVQFNEVSGMKGTMDGEGYDSDYNSRHTLFQYNYSHDNDGGFMLICNDGSQSPPWNIGNEGTVIRYNLSVNDGLHTFNITGPCQNTQIYNNVFYVGKGSDIPLVASGNWGGGDKWPADTRFFNNVFYIAGKARFDFGGMKSVTFAHNAYWGAITNPPADTHAVLSDPQLAAPGIPSVRGYLPRSGSPLHGAGQIILDNGGRDFWGNSLPPAVPPDIGASQGSSKPPAPTALGRKSSAEAAIHAGMTGAQVRRRLGEPSRITLVPVLTSRHFYQAWRYALPGASRPYLVTLDEHDRVLSAPSYAR